MTADHQEDPHQGWNVKLRLAIDADNADEARAIAEEVWRKMEVTAGAEPQIIRSDGRTPHWNVISDLDLSALESITPDDAVTRFRYVIRNLPGVVFSGDAADDRRSGLWQWLPDSWELAWQDQELAHPAVRAAGIRIVVVKKKKSRYPALPPSLAAQQGTAYETHGEG